MRTVDPKLQERQEAFTKRFNLPSDEPLLKGKNFFNENLFKFFLPILETFFILNLSQNSTPENTLTDIILLVYSAALHKQLLLHGRLFVSSNYVCFHSNIFGIKTTEVIAISEIIEIKKNFYNLSLGIQINTATKQVKNKKSEIDWI